MSKYRKTAGFFGAPKRDWVRYSVFEVDSDDWVPSQNGITDDIGIIG